MLENAQRIEPSFEVCIWCRGAVYKPVRPPNVIGPPGIIAVWMGGRDESPDAAKAWSLPRERDELPEAAKAWSLPRERDESPDAAKAWFLPRGRDESPDAARAWSLPHGQRSHGGARFISPCYSFQGWTQKMLPGIELE